MKKLVIIAALMVAALVGRAQQPADSVSVMFRKAATADAQLAKIANAQVTHAAMVGVGGAVMLLGNVFTMSGVGALSGENPDSGRMYMKIGIGITAVGCALLATSFIPLAGKKVRLDQRGIVVDLP